MNNRQMDNHITFIGLLLLEKLVSCNQYLWLLNIWLVLAQRYVSILHIPHICTVCVHITYTPYMYCMCPYYIYPIYVLYVCILNIPNICTVCVHMSILHIPNICTMYCNDCRLLIELLRY